MRQFIPELLPMEYKICVCDYGDMEIHNATFEQLVTRETEALPADMEEYEFIYALREDLGRVLKLGVGEHFGFKPNRDNDLSIGIILRMS
jgi:hypothetical protein